MGQKPSGLELLLSATDALVQIVLVRQGEIAVSQDWHCDNRATEILPAALEAIFQLLALNPKELERIACVHGPGSFTGIRLALALAQALRRVSGAKLGALNGLQILAYEYQLRHTLPAGRLLFVVTHARRNLVHFQAFAIDALGCPKAFSPISLLAPDALGPLLPCGAVCLGNALGKYPELFAAYAKQASLLLAPEILHPSPQALQRAASSVSYLASDLEPLYVRPLDALENLSRLAARQGLSQQEAWQTYRHLVQEKPVSAI
ncbi:MAG: tRNA (adenosine(37)-N6)-threonylcarbamoyltransferase complex dimerization subunit type 1 TsaB [Desulfovibrio sp.]|nr:tRNA (adenosine(37)-N6)-threonylcarbamoyltransferase complex dimerization subunit type 1 TsaB [Desulfovibrio sp.]